MQQPPNPRLEPIRRTLIEAGREILRFAIDANSRPDPVRFAANGGIRAIDNPPDPRLSYQPISGCPWCQVNLRLAGVAYCLERAISFLPGTAAYLQMARNELVSVRAMITANPGEIRALENEIGQIQMRLIAQDPDIEDLLRSVNHIMDVATRAAETPHPASIPAANRAATPIPTAERIHGSHKSRSDALIAGSTGGSSSVVGNDSNGVRDAGADPTPG